MNSETQGNKHTFVDNCQKIQQPKVSQPLTYPSTEHVKYVRKHPYTFTVYI
jgi:hypothetical protein